VSTCRGYVKNVLAKLGAHTQLEAVIIATPHGLIHAITDGVSASAARQILRRRLAVIIGTPFPEGNADGRDLQDSRISSVTSTSRSTESEPYVIQGSGRRISADQVRFHEKDKEQGTDVRVWQITPGPGGSGAEHAAVF
jgi:hypothetical protein